MVCIFADLAYIENRVRSSALSRNLQLATECVHSFRVLYLSPALPLTSSSIRFASVVTSAEVKTLATSHFFFHIVEILLIVRCRISSWSPDDFHYSKYFEAHQQLPISAFYLKKTIKYVQLDNLVCSPRSFFMAEDNWFGFVALSKDKKEVSQATCVAVLNVV